MESWMWLLSCAGDGRGGGAGQTAFLIGIAQDLTLSRPLTFPGSLFAAGNKGDFVILFQLV